MLCIPHFLFIFVLLLLSLCVMLGSEVCMNCTTIYYYDTCKCIFFLGAPACLNFLGSFKQINDDDVTDAVRVITWLVCVSVCLTQAND